jgi:hypothetical protein
LVILASLLLSVGVAAAQGNGPGGPGGRGPGGAGTNAGCAGEFVDEDGDGICDLAGTGQGYGSGAQAGTQTRQAQGFLARAWAKSKGWGLWRAGQ